jgi:hypothetical protein
MNESTHTMLEQTANCSCPENMLDTWTSLMENNLTPTIGCLGLLGNLAAIYVLKCPEFKSTFHQSLLTLAICDICLLSFLLVDILVDVNNVWYIYMLPYFWNPLKYIMMSWETFLIMSIATERFMAVCNPLLYRRHKLRCSSLTHLLTYILPGLVCAILLNIPKFLELELVIGPENVDFDATTLRMNKNYIYYYTHWTRLLTTGIVPTIFLFVTNTAIILKMKEGRMQSEQLQNNINKVKIVKSLALTLTAIVLVYLVCNIPRLVINLLEYLLLPEIYKLDECGCYLAPWWLPSLLRSSHLLLTINCSVNFLIYVFVSKRIKKVFKIRITKLFNKLREQALKIQICKKVEV